MQQKLINIIKKHSEYFAILDCSVLEKERAFLQQKIEQGIPNHLNFLERNVEMRTDIKKWFPQAESIILILFPYWDSTMPEDKTIISKADWLKLRQLRGKKKPSMISQQHLTGLKNVKVSRYILSQDYHEVVGNILQDISKELKKIYPKIESKTFVDSSPVMEKALSEKAQLGKIGKNMLLINKEIGSYFFIGGIAVSEKLESFISTKPTPVNLCEICDDKCIKACPSNALSEKGLDYNKCFSSWNTQTKNPIPENIENKMGNLVEGCDICQQVCPYNQNTKTKSLDSLKPLNR